MVVGCDFVEDFFATPLTAVLDHVPLVFAVVYADRIHLAATKGCTIPWAHIIDMTRTETKRAVIPSGSFSVWWNLLVAVFTLK